MTDHPILFQPDLVRAILGGHKTQTRRLISFPGVDKVITFPRVAFDLAGRPVYEMKDRNGVHLTRPAGKGLAEYQFWPKYAVGDRLYVRERFSGAYELGGMPPREWDPTSPIWYWADGNPEDGDWTKPKPGIHMPRWASRVTLTVTDIRIERVQSITEDDAQAEGVGEPYLGDGDPPFEEQAVMVSRHMQFRNLWKRINGAASWTGNPWVVAVSFSVEKQNIDDEASAA